MRVQVVYLNKIILIFVFSYRNFKNYKDLRENYLKETKAFLVNSKTSQTIVFKKHAKQNYYGIYAENISLPRWNKSHFLFSYHQKRDIA